jgi:hypothetical protein
MRSRVVLACALLVLPSAARADHHAMMAAPHEDAPAWSASLSLLAASFSTQIYAGDYEAVAPSAGWSRGRFAAGATIAMYRLEENGRELFGPGDAVVTGQAAVLARRDTQAGALLAVSLPTGAHLDGLGMGHVMAMPALWGAHSFGALGFSASAGYSRALAGQMSHHDHGPWPLVEPMNLSEITWSAAADYALGSGMRTGARISGGIPLLATGNNRIVGAARIAWGTPRVETAAELQVGIDGDPFKLRGVLQSAVHF